MKIIRWFALRRMFKMSILTVALVLFSTGCASGKRGLKGFGGESGAMAGSDSRDALRPGEDARYTYIHEPLYFAYDSAQIDAAERQKIEPVADGLRQNFKTGVIIEGHCDERGSREYNMALGERRAQAVRSYLMVLGIDGSRIYTKSFGEESPSASGHDERFWSLNRRAEFVLVD